MSDFLKIFVISSLLGIVAAFVLRQYAYRRAHKRMLLERQAIFEARMHELFPPVAGERDSFIKANSVGKP